LIFAQPITDQGKHKYCDLSGVALSRIADGRTGTDASLSMEIDQLSRHDRIFHGPIGRKLYQRALQTIGMGLAYYTDQLA
jgi:hypothetical protein